METINIAGLKIDACTKDELLNILSRRLKSDKKTVITTIYSEFLVSSLKDNKVREILNKADISLADGIGIFWAKRFLELPLTAKSYWGKIIQAFWQTIYTLAAIIFYPRWVNSALPEKIPGSDLVWDLAKLAANNNLSIYLLGGFGDTPQLAVNKISTCLNDGRHLNKYLKIAGWSNKNPDDATVIDDINKKKPDFLFVAFGPIKQEKWILENFPKLSSVKLAIGLGGTFDYLAGKKISPPRFLRKVGLEWLWRLFTQPYRIRRIIKATFGLVKSVFRHKILQSLPFRPNVVSVVLNAENKILICEFNPKHPVNKVFPGLAKARAKDYWQLPQGGINKGEDIVKAAFREALEETGLKDLNFLKLSDKIYSYTWPAEYRLTVPKRYRYWGQKQNIVYFRYNGRDDEVKLDYYEFLNYKWVNISELASEVHQEKQGLAKIIQEDLKDMREKGIINQLNIDKIE